MYETVRGGAPQGGRDDMGAHELVDDGRVREESVHLTLDLGRAHHVVDVVGVVRVDAHLGERVEPVREKGGE